MKPDDFEKNLERLPLRKIPTEWRADILSAARQATSTPHVFRSLLSAINSQLSTLLWPHPKAWAGLAAIWLGLLVVNLGTASKTDAGAKRMSSPPQIFMALKEQQQLLTELIGAQEAPAAEPAKPAAPRPRSERRKEFLIG